MASRLLEEIAAATGDAPGVTRAAYGAGEQRAHDIVRREAERLGAQARVDAAGNLYLTLPGADRTLPALVIGSHLDSVPHGGNYDGAAGVVAGVAALSALRERGRPSRDVTVMAIRSEEAAWFPVSYPGSRAALGLLPDDALDAPRADTGRSLAEHMREAGFDPRAVARGERQIKPDRIAAFVELHIEQGPRLVDRGCALGIVTAINGGFRYQRARCLGTYAHSGAEPRRSRADSVLGFTEFVNALEALWDRLAEAGKEFTLTFGRVESDPAQHGGSRVLGELGFTLDVRSEHQDDLDAVRREIERLADAAGHRRHTRIDLGEAYSWAPGRMDADIVERLSRTAAHLGLAAPVLSSGAGHDAAVFASAGIPTGMIFVRNAHGSHNPDEHLDMADLDRGIQLLLGFVNGYEPA
nr:Zn-dependent hydrolase [Ancylobacter gelatini]